MERTNKDNGDYSSSIEPRVQLKRTDFLVLKLLSLITVAGYLTALVLNLTHMGWEEYAVVVLGEIPRTITWLLLILFLKKFTGTREITDALKKMLFCLLGMIILGFLGGFLSGSPVISFILFLIFMAAILSVVFYIKAGISMFDTNGKTPDLETFGKVIIYCVTLGFIAALAIGAFSGHLSTTMQRIGLGVITLTNITPFLVLFRTMSQTEKTILN